MKNVSIRTKILLGVFLINFIGLVTVMVYLHESYSGGVDVTAQKSVAMMTNTWGEMSKVAADEFGPVTVRTGAMKYADALKAITGADIGIMLDKSAISKDAYEKQLAAANLPSNWDERQNYVLVASTDAALSDEMQLNATADTIPEIGKVIGVENGACSKTCHGAVTGTGDFWKVRWSKDSKSRAHVVFPILDDGGKIVGVVYGIEDVTDAADAARASQVRTFSVIAFGLVLATALIAWLLNSLVFRRLNNMIMTMEDISVRVAGGDFGARYTPTGSNDEIGKFEQFFARFMDLISSTLQSLVKK